MKSLLHTLNDNEAVLLMYLFDELPAEDRAEVEEMLSFDSGLRSELEQLKLMHGLIGSSLQMADAKLNSARAESAVRRNTYKLVDQFNTRRLLARPAAYVRPRSRMKLVAYAAAVAAMVLVGLSYFWIMSSDDHYIGPGLATTYPVTGEDEARMIGSFAQDNSGENTEAISDARSIESSDLLRKSLDSGEEMLNDAVIHVDLAAAEREIQTLAILGDVKNVSGDDQILLQ